MVAENAYLLCQMLIVRRNRTALARRTKILAWIE
jgi:hypothetical protein